MEYIHLGRSGLSVSRICLGTMNFGPLTPATEAEAIMDHAHEIGINFFDTANRYGGAQSPPGGFCASPSCGKPFVNVGRGTSRRYCSTACGTRERVAKHRAIQAGTSETALP